MNARTCQVDLVARERGARVSERERLALDAHVQGCADCSAGRRLLDAFDVLGTVEAEDGARLERLAQLALSRTAARHGGSSRRARPGLRAALLAAAAFLVVGSSAAALWWSSEAREPSLAAPAPKLASSAPLRAAPAGATAVPSSATVIETPAPDPDEQPARDTARALTSSSGALATQVESAASLLKRAGAAQRRGERDAAVAWFRKLQAQHPASSETLVSRVSLGRILAQSGQASAALREFELYLSVAPGGPLAPEALYGRGRALGVLGDRDTERRTWQRLLTHFPDSAYSGTARRRLAELP